MADAPPIVAASADGVLHQFPAGTDPSVVDGVMKQYAAERAPKEQPKVEPPNEDLIEPGAMARKAGQTLVGGAGETVTGVGAIAKGVGRAEPGQSSTDLDMMRALDDGTDFGKLMKAAPNDLARVAIRQYQLADADQRQAMKQAAINKVAEPPGQVETTGEHMMKAGESITAAGKETFPVTPQEEQRPDVIVTGMVAGIAKYIGAGVAGGMPALIGVAGVDAYGKTYNDARTAGATEEQATTAALGNGLLQGGLMTLPIGQFTKAFDLVPIPLKSKMMGAVVEAVKGGTTLTAFSQLSTIADNVVAKNTYDPNRPVTQGVGENLAETFAAGAILPLVGAGANRLFRGRDQVPNPKPVLDAPTIDDAIAKADQVASGPVDVGEIARGAQEFGNEGEKQQAKLLQLFQGLNEGEIHPAPDGGFAWHQGDEQVPLKVWDEKAAKPAAEGETGVEAAETPATISPGLASAQREHYGKLGIDVVYFENDPRIPFDGAVSPENPNTIFLSNDPQRNATQVAAHEVTHVLESTTLPDGTRLVDVLHGQIARGLTPAGLQHGIDVFGKGAPQRGAFPEGQEGNAAHADAYMRHLIGEIGADIGGEAPKFQTFLPKVVNEVQARYGDEAAKGVVQKLIAGFQQAYRTLRAFFFKPEEMAEYGQPETQSQHWVTNLGEIHDTLAKMYAERFGTQAEKENAALVAMKDKAAQARLLKTPAGGATEAARPQGAEKAPEGQPGAKPTPASPAATPAAYETSRQKAATYKRWIGELERQGASDRDIGTVRKAYQAERQRMADILAAQPAEQVGTGPQKRLEGAALVTPAPRGPITPENVFRPETYGAERGSAPTARSGAEAPAPTEERRTVAEEPPVQESPTEAPPTPIVAEPPPAPKRQVRPDAHERLQAKAAEATKLEATPPEEWQPTADELSQARRVSKGWTPETERRRPQTLTDFVRKNGGLRLDTPEAAELQASDIGKQPGLLQRRGVQADWMAQRARDEGFRLGKETTHGSGIDTDAFVKALIEDASGRTKHMPEGEDTEGYRQQQAHFIEFHNYLEDMGIKPKGMDPRQLAWILRQEPEVARVMALAERADREGLPEGSSLELAFHLDNEIAKAQAELTPEPGAYEMGDHREEPAPDLAELDAYYDEHRTAEPDQAGGRPAEEGRPAAEGADEGREPEVARPEEASAAPEAPGARPAGDEGVGPRFSPRGETEPKGPVLLDTREATKDELAARQRQRDKEEAEARMRGRKGGKVPQESADETPLFGGPRQSTLFSPKSDEPFFSSLKRGVEALRIEKAAPGQWEATIRNMPGVKADERAWVGIEDWLRTQTKPVTKAEVLGYIDEHEVKVGEKVKGGPLVMTPELRDDMARRIYGREETYRNLPSEQRERVDDALRAQHESHNPNAPKFGSYVLPGGKNYKELLLTLPEKEGERGPKGWGDTAGGTADTTNFRGSHFDEPNVLAHIRMDDRTGPNGEKVLHVAEIQSDWHQQGRKKGYAGAVDKAEIDARLNAATKRTMDANAEMDRLSRERDPVTNRMLEESRWHELARERDAARDEMDRLGRGPEGVPDAPFKTSWPELAMKRVLRYAAENGYDRVSWDTGETNAARYDLSKQVRELTYTGDDRLIATGHKGEMLINKVVTREELPDIIGKEAADKLLAQKPKRYSGDIDDNTRHLTGTDLKVGGEGMKAFYDKQLPVIANKIGKRFGAKVEASKVETKPAQPFDEFAKEYRANWGDVSDADMRTAYEAYGREQGAGAHSIPVTGAMREGVMQGQPLFSPRLTGESNRKYTPEERKAYEELGRAPETKTIAERWAAFKDQLGKRMLIATVDKYLATKSIDPMAYMAQRNFNSSSGALEVLLTKGTLKLNGSAFDFAQRNGGVETQVIRPLHGEHGDWAWWVAANRAERLSQEDREHLFTPRQIETLKKTNRGQLDFDYQLPNGTTTRSREAAYMDTLRKYDEFNKNVMGLGVKAGLFKQETVDKLWANPFYVPFFRVAEKEGAAPFTGGQQTGGFAKQYGFKTLTGGTGKLHNDLWENVIGNWGHLIDAAGKNIGANQVLDAASLPSNGVARKVTQQEYDHKMTKADRESSTWTMVDGKKQYWHVNDPLLFDAISAIHAANFTDPFSKAANFFSRTLRMGVTSDPGFMLRVTIKDSEQAVATAPMSYNVLGNIVKGYQMTDLPGALMNVARAAAGMHEQALRESDELISVMAGGGLMRLGAGHAEGFRRTTAESMSGADLTWADGFRYIKRGARQVKEVLAQSEDINRAALYSELIKRGVPHDEATFAARDLEDFTLSGAAPWVRWIAHAVTFLNAGAQGLYKVGRSAADADRNVTAAVGGKVAWAASARVAKVMTATVLATLALDYIYRNDEDYKKRAEYDRNGKWWFKIGQYQFQIPMGFELAGLARIATNGLDMFFDKEMTGRRWANNALSIVGQNMFMNPTPTAIAPLVDVRTNTTGTGQPIEPKGMENLRPEQRYTSQDTLAARGLSAVGNKIARGIGGPTAEFSSPLQLDYLWNGYTGWLGSAVLGSADRVARQFTNEPVKPAKEMWSFITGNIVSKGTNAQSRYIDTMYQQAEAADKAYGTYEDLIKRQQFAKAQDFYKANAELINRRGLVDAVVRAETSLNQQIRLIQNNPNPQITGEQKRLQIQQLQAIRNRTAESAFGAH